MGSKLSEPITYADLCIATKAEQPFDRDGWIFELKYDGFRMLASRRAGLISLHSRRGTDFTEQFPEIVAELEKLTDVVLDCELVMLDSAGVPQFEPLVRRSRLTRDISIEHAARTSPAVLYAFDLLELKGQDLRERPLLKRKESLRKAIAKATRIRPVDHFVGDGITLFQLAAKNSIEGVVAKRADSPYKAGRSPDWIKIKTSVGRAIDEQRAKWNERPSSDADEPPNRGKGGLFGGGRGRR
jgi:bifunctional non-homologous end joining protein LigD